MIWRANGTLLFLVGVCSILGIIVLGLSLVSDTFRKREVHDIVNVNPTTKKEEFLRLGYFQNLKGTELLLVPLTSEQKIDMEYYSKSAKASARNYLIFNNLTKESFWIWPSSQSMILETEIIHDQSIDEKYQKAVGLIFERVEKDTNSDGVLNNKDEKAIEYFDLSTNKLMTIHRGFDLSLGTQKNSANQILFFYMRDGKNYFQTLTIPTLAISAENEIPVKL